MSYFFSVDGRSIPIHDLSANRPAGTDPFLGSVSLKEQARLDKEASEQGLRPDTEVVFNASERIPNGTKGTILKENIPLHTVVISGAAHSANDISHFASIIQASA